ncbi:D-Ala-D-Ala carboxypeptidase family metallohydrolase [Tumebacillus flagellatus]|uniref:Peptidase M15A C-terminal domain-containing protein n=1 Tax=Tumebacillus flagellatus TaxID=1157490 RepID=A0A074LVW3_9BACL|nr:D-Ala-D-Ala carboxypeptidase family metallohydrolase [Tumebacillus flagellatus]KEO84695.1 hypothetical protein EL26_04025 [Tumebacillus flagellatus]
MKSTFAKGALALAVAAAAFSFVGVDAASAASQNISASITKVVAADYYIYMSWGAVSGASKYVIKTSNYPSVDASDVDWATTTGTTLTKQMATNVGYRYFRVYAYDSAGTLLGYSNQVGAAKYQSGSVIRMKTDSSLTSSYPAPTGTNYTKPVWFITLDSTSKAAYVSPNFQLGEFISESTITSGIVDPMMVQHLQNARNRKGSAMSLNSGYRTPGHNASVGGATYSRHMYGDAVDVPATTTSDYNYYQNLFAPEGPDYVESFAEAGYSHWHGDWRNEVRDYSNF